MQVQPSRATCATHTETNARILQLLILAADLQQKESRVKSGRAVDPELEGIAKQPRDTSHRFDSIASDIQRYAHRKVQVRTAPARIIVVKKILVP